MARKLKEASAGVGDNDARAAIIRQAADEILDLEKDKAEISAKISKVKQRVKGEGIKLREFNTALRIYALSAEDRNASLAGIKIAFDALELGSQGELFPVTAEPEADNVEAVQEAPPYDVQVAGPGTVHVMDRSA